MFNGNFHHPLDNLIKDDRLFMMEAILPFVDDRMKAPLAMYIKIMELQTILNALRDTNYVNSCGLHKDINNQDDILSSLAGCGFPEYQEPVCQHEKSHGYDEDHGSHEHTAIHGFSVPALSKQNCL